MERGANVGPSQGLKNSGELDLPYLGQMCRSLLSYLVAFIRCSHRWFYGRSQKTEQFSLRLA